MMYNWRWKMVKLSVLDYAHIDEGKTAREALNYTVELAKHADQIGFHRFWMAEHHNVPAFASSSPELIMMKLADETKNIRIGSGGVMLPHYSPYKVAENFRILEAYHPNRIDLGMGNTVGTQLVNDVLNEKKKSRLGYQQSVQDIYKYLTDKDDPDHRFNEINANPQMNTMPEMFLLSTSVRNAKVAARNGIGYTFGLFPYASKDKTPTAIEAAKVYREEFVPSKSLKEPKVILSMFISVSDDEEKAKKQQRALELWILGKDNFGELDRFPSYETAENYEYTEKDKKILERNRERMIYGHIDEVEVELRELIDVTKADEILIIPLMEGIENRKKALDLIHNRFSE